MCDGARYDVTHPDQVVLSTRWTHVGIGGDGGGMFQDVALLANIHITRIEPVKKGRKPRRTRK